MMKHTAVSSLSRAVVAGLALAALGAALILGLAGTGQPAQAQAPTTTTAPGAPPACVCSQPHQLPGPSGPSLIYNCQCGALQCVVSVFTPPLRPDGNGPSLVCLK